MPRLPCPFHPLLSHRATRQQIQFSKYVWGTLCACHWFINQSTIMIHWTSKRRPGLTVKCQKTFPPGLSISKRLNWGISLHLSFSQVLHPIWVVEVRHCVSLSTLLFSERFKKKQTNERWGIIRAADRLTFGFSPHWTSHCELSLWLQGWHIPSVFYSFIKRTFDCFHYLGASRNNIFLPQKLHYCAKVLNHPNFFLFWIWTMKHASLHMNTIYRIENAVSFLAVTLQHQRNVKWIKISYKACLRNLQFQR